MTLGKYVAIGLAAFALSGGTAFAGDFPSRPIQVIVPYSAGGSTDLSARIMADVLKKHLSGTTVVIRNQPGGGGGIGTSAVVHARPDGYTLGTGSQGPLAILPHFGGTDYSINDVDFLGLMARNLQVVVACKNAPFSTFKEFMDYAKANPGKLQVGNSAAGGANHISMEAFAKIAKAKFANVPYNGASEAMTACVGGHVSAMVAQPSEAKAQADSGAIKPLFVMEDVRLPDFPDTPTAVEEGYDFTWSSWRGIIAPKGLPADVKAKLEKALEETFKDKEFRSRMTAMGDFVDYRSGEDFKKLAHRDSDMAEQVIRDLGMYGMNKK